MLLKNTRDSPVQFQTKQNAPGKNVCRTLFTIITTLETDITWSKVQHRYFLTRILFHLEFNRKLHIIFSEALGKVSPKIRRLRRLWREGFPERQYSRS